MDNIKMKKYDYNILFWLFASIPLVDFINGTLITVLNFSNDVSLGKFYRILTILLLGYFIIKYSTEEERKRNIILATIVGGVIFIYLLIFFTYHRSFKGIVFDAISISKLFLVLLIIYTMVYLFKKKLINLSLINKILDFYLLIFPATMIIPYILGIGSSTYSSGLGYTGLYFANNDLSIVLVISTVYGLNNLIVKRDIKSSVLFILNLVSLLIVGAKTGVIGLFIALLAYGIFYGRKVISTKSISNKNKIIIGIALMGIIISVLIIFYPIFEKMLHRIIYFYNKEGNIFAALLSGREKFLSIAINSLLQEKLFIIKLLFGSGFFYRNGWGEGSLVEMDLMDIVFSLGLIFAVIIVYYIIRFLYKSIKNLDEKNFMFLIGICVMIMFSLIAGHVAFSALSGSILALLISGEYMCNLNKEDNDKNNIA